MKNLKTYILFLLCLIIPIGVSAHSVDTGSVTKVDGETDIPIMLNLEEDLPSGSAIKITNCQKDNSNVTCSITTGSKDGVGSTGVLAQDVKSGTQIQIGTIILKSTDTTQNTGTVSVSVAIDNSDPLTLKTQFTVNGAKTKSTSASLKTLTTTQGTISPEFNGDTLDYTIYNLKDTINSVTINYTCDNCSVTSDASDNLTISKGTSYVKAANLTKGENTLNLNVTSEDGSQTKTYTLTILRGETEYDSAKLASLDLGEYTISPKFNEDTTEYSVSVPYSITDLKEILEAKLKDENAEMTIEGADELVVGENKVTISITSVNKDNTKDYTLTVTRLSSDDIILISYINGKITFKDADGKKQTLTESKFKNQYPEVWEDIQNKKYKFDEDGNLITEETTTKNGSGKIIIIIIVVILAIAIIGVTGFFLFRKKDPAKEKAKQEKKVKQRAEKAARKAELEKMEKEYYDEYYKEYDEDDDDEEEEETPKKSKSSKKSKDDEEITDEDKLNKDEAKSLLDDDYLFPYDDDEEEEETPKRRHKDDDVVDVDSALEDLMYTKTYDFSEELKDVKDLDDEYDDEDE